MLNGSAFNASGLNGAAATAALVFASATFTADATVTATADHQHAGRGNWNNTTNSIFHGQKEVFAFAQWTAGGGEVFATPVRDLAGRGNWINSSGFQAAALNTVYAVVDWNLSLTTTFIPGAQFGTGDWTASATLVAEPVLTHKAGGSWTVASGWAADEALAIRGAWGDWTLDAVEFLVEETWTDGVDVIHEAHFRPSVSLDWYIDPSKVDAAVRELLWFLDADFAAIPTLTQKVSGAWEVGASNLYMVCERIIHATAAWSTGSTLAVTPKHIQDAGEAVWVTNTILTGGTLQEHSGRTAWSGEISLTGTAWQTMALTGAWTMRGSMAGDGERQKLGEGSWSVSLQWDAPVPYRAALATANWVGGAAGSFTGTGLLKLTDAPEERRLVITDDLRGIIIPEDDRTFRITKRSELEVT